MTDRPITREEFLDITNKVFEVAGSIVNDGIRKATRFEQYITKGDKTVVTVTDKLSQQESLEAVWGYKPGVAILAEEAEKTLGQLTARHRFTLDGLDGTGGYLMGAPTPTIILDHYDTHTGNVDHVGVLWAATMEMYTASRGQGAFRHEYPNQSISAIVPLKVNKQPLNGASVMIDVDHAFARVINKRSGEKKQILSDLQRRTLSQNIESLGAKPCSFYTNGGHYALVAGGRPTAVACITTAIGQPADISGTLLVEEAKGCVQSYIIEGNHLDPITVPNVCMGENFENTVADLVIGTNTIETLALLESALQDAIRNPLRR